MAVADGGVAVDRNALVEFLTSCIELLKGQATREALKDASSGRPGKKLFELQKGVWGDLGISPQAGRQAIQRIEVIYPDDNADLVSLRERFATAVDAAYLQCLEDRRPSKLVKKGKLPRDTLLEFLDACNVKLDLPEVRASLCEHVKNTGAMPEATLNALHDGVMELVGFERAHGQRCMRELGSSERFNSDREVAMSVARWRGKSRDVCLNILEEYREEGGQLNVDETVELRLLEMRAQKALQSDSVEERAEILKKNAHKVKVLRALPPDGQDRYWEKLKDTEKLELAKCEVLMAAVAQHQQEQLVLGQRNPE